MGGLYWSTAYVQSTLTEKIASAIRETMETRTKFKLHALPPETSLSYSCLAAGSNLLCVSPMINGWSGFCGGMHRFQSLVMEQNRLSGCIFQVDEYFWEFTIWKDGEIVHWFISQSKNNFGFWDEKLFRIYVARYLNKRGIQLDHLDFRNALLEVERNRHLFIGDGSLLKHFTKDSVSETTITQCLEAEPEQAFFILNDILNFPYPCLSYDPIAIGTYFDVKRGVTTLENADWGTEASYQHGQQIYRIDDFHVIPFHFSEGLSHSDLYMDKDLIGVACWGLS